MFGGSSLKLDKFYSPFQRMGKRPQALGSPKGGQLCTIPVVAGLGVARAGPPIRRCRSETRAGSGARGSALDENRCHCREMMKKPMLRLLSRRLDPRRNSSMFVRLRAVRAEISTRTSERSSLLTSPPIDLLRASDGAGLRHVCGPTRVWMLKRGVGEMGPKSAGGVARNWSESASWSSDLGGYRCYPHHLMWWSRILKSEPAGASPTGPRSGIWGRPRATPGSTCTRERWEQIPRTYRRQHPSPVRSNPAACSGARPLCTSHPALRSPGRRSQNVPDAGHPRSTPQRVDNFQI